MNTQLTLITLIILLLSFFSSSQLSSYTGTAVSDVTSSSFHDSSSVSIWKGNAFSESSTGEETLTFTLPRKPTSCTLTGQWKTDNDFLNNLGRKQRECHNAEGTFVGYIDAYGQYVDTDPSNFRWAGPTDSSVDPEPTRMEGYIMYAWTCDHLYYTPKGKRNYARAWVENFGDTTLTLRTEYFDEQYQPSVDFTYDLDCELQREKKVEQHTVVLPPQHVEEPTTFDSDAFPVDIEELEPLVQDIPAGKGDSFVHRLKIWFTSVLF